MSAVAVPGRRSYREGGKVIKLIRGGVRARASWPPEELEVRRSCRLASPARAGDVAPLQACAQTDRAPSTQRDLALALICPVDPAGLQARDRVLAARSEPHPPPSGAKMLTTDPTLVRP